MKLRLPALAVMVVVLAGCGSHPVPSAAAAGRPVPCHEQYERWKQGAVSTEIGALTNALHSVQAEASSVDLLGLRGTIERAGQAAARLESSGPPPRCADPKGYFRQLLTQVKTAGDNVRTASGMSGLFLVEAPLKSAGKFVRELMTELNQTVGRER